MHEMEMDRLPDSRHVDENRGIGFPRLYDLLVFLLTHGREPSYREALLDLAGLEPGQRLLDIGAGTGTQAMAAWRRVQPKGAVVGVDISANMVAVAARKARHARMDIPFYRADAADLPFRDADFDIVTVTTVLHMMEASRRQLCLDEIHRVLRPGGLALLVDYAGAPGERGHMSARHGLHGRFDLATMRDGLARRGFADIRYGALDWLSLSYMTARKPEAGKT